jgi:hypothetical protein
MLQYFYTSGTRHNNEIRITHDLFPKEIKRDGARELRSLHLAIMAHKLQS